MSYYVTCDCGTTVKQNSFKNHKLSKIHLKRLEINGKKPTDPNFNAARYLKIDPPIKYCLEYLK